VHPLAVLPLRRLRPFSTLVIGSMVPDVPRFVLPFGEPHKHTLPEILFVYLPCGLFLLWLFHRFLKQPVIALFPRRIQACLMAHTEEFHLFPLKRFLVVIILLLTGIGTHLLWDSFTHDGGWAIRELGLDSTTVSFSNYQLRVVDLLQDVSTLGGALLLIALVALGYAKHTSPISDEVPDTIRILGITRASLIVAGIVIAFLPALVMFARDPIYWLHNERRQFVGFVAVSATDNTLLEVFAYSALWHIAMRTRQQAQEPSAYQ
jgi:hypothetical protein